MILLVDDEDIVRRAIERSLQREGYEVVEASDGWEALDLLAMDRFDLVITDLTMPKLDGTALTIQIHNNWPEIPVLIMSAADPNEAARRLMLEKSLEFLRKPFAHEVLIASVQRLLPLEL